jgi:hypothetical protein
MHDITVNHYDIIYIAMVVTMTVLHIIIMQR